MADSAAADAAALVERIEALGARLSSAKASIDRRFIGQEKVVDLVLTAMLCGGHALLVGLPGLGKTRLVDTLSTVMGLKGNRIQFTPDLMPADILGSEVLDTAGWSVDILVSNAGNQNRKALVEMSREEWQKIQDVHVGGAFNCSRVFLPGMCARGFGRVVMTSSVSGQSTMSARRGRLRGADTELPHAPAPLNALAGQELCHALCAAIPHAAFPGPNG